MSHENHREIVEVSVLDSVDDRLEDLFAKRRHEGQCGDEAFVGLDDKAVLPARVIQGVGRGTVADQFDIGESPKATVGLYAAAGIVVAGSDNNSHGGEGAMETSDAVVEKGLGGSARLLDVEDVAAYKKGVWIVFRAPLVKLLEKIFVFVNTVVILVQHLSKVQVGGVKYSHRNVRVVYDSVFCVGK